MSKPRRRSFCRAGPRSAVAALAASAGAHLLGLAHTADARPPYFEPIRELDPFFVLDVDDEWFLLLNPAAELPPGWTLTEVRIPPIGSPFVPPVFPAPAIVIGVPTMPASGVQVPGGATNFNAQMSFRMDALPPVGATEVFQTEMLQLDLFGGSLPPGVMLRESPTRASLGTTTITPVPGGYMIDSFFDVFTELSVDGGQSWIPSAAGPARLNAMPAPGAALLLAAGAALAGRRRR